jgi:PAS domain S-box-containing protein
VPTTPVKRVLKRFSNRLAKASGLSGQLEAAQLAESAGIAPQQTDRDYERSGATNSVMTEKLDRHDDLIEKRVAERTAELTAREQELRNQNILFNAALTNMSQGLVMFDAQGRVVICNQRYLDMYSLTADQVQPGCTLEQLLNHRLATGSFAGDPAKYAEEILGRMAVARVGTRIIELADGRTIAISNQPMPTGGWVATHEDITERRQAEKQIAYMARHDTLTDLPNRARLREWLTQALTHSHHGRPLAVHAGIQRSMILAPDTRR